MLFTQYYLDCLSHASYLIGDESTGRAVVIDPRRDIAEYLADAEQAGVTIELVIETHFHADFLSGHLELAEATGAEIVYSSVAETELVIAVTSASVMSWVSVAVNPLDTETERSSLTSTCSSPIDTVAVTLTTFPVSSYAPGVSWMSVAPVVAVIATRSASSSKSAVSVELTLEVTATPTFS